MTAHRPWSGISPATCLRNSDTPQGYSEAARLIAHRQGEGHDQQAGDHKGRDLRPTLRPARQRTRPRDLLAAHQFPAKPMKIGNAGPAIQSHRNQETALQLARRSLQHGAAAYPSEQRSRCCLPPAKAMAMPGSSSTAIIIAAGCASSRPSSQQRCPGWPCRRGNSSWMRFTLAKPSEGARVVLAGPRSQDHL